MNRKGTREQNDISIIIGNLPKRLQDKIIIREGNSSSGGNVVDTNKKGGSKSNENTRTSSDGILEKQNAGVAVAADKRPTPMDDEVTTIDYFLRLPAGTDVEHRGNVVRSVLESSGPTTNVVQVKLLQKPAVENADRHEEVSIPGLIRLNAENAKKMNETPLSAASSSSNGLRNHERRNRHQTRQEVLSTSKHIMPMSPARHVQRINHPNWFELLEETWANRLPPLFETLQQIMQQNQAIEVDFFNN